MIMQAEILSIGTALPPYEQRQEEMGRQIPGSLGLSEIQGAKLQKIYEKSAIYKRHTVLDDLFGSEWRRFFSEDTIPKMKERNELYKEKAFPLAAAAARKAFEKWKGDPALITHVISVSCTGVFAPGIEFSLIREFGLRNSVERLGINFMGCFGAFRALATANALALENPKNRILIVCTELCSLHFQPTKDWDSLIGSALFADGAAAAIVGVKGENPCFTIVNKGSIALENSFEEMQWEAGDTGFLMKLTLRVPMHLRLKIREFVESLLQDKAEIKGCDFPLHPGGKAILEQVEEELGLSKTQTESSWNVLSQCGNMSSATFLFVLEELLKKPRELRHPFAVGVGFGPGLAMEGVLLRQHG